MQLTRASFDIGSGSTKLQVSVIKKVEGVDSEIIETKFASERPCAFGFDWQKSTDSNLSESIQNQGLIILKELKDFAIELGCTAFVGVATEVFRKAKNGMSYLDKIRAMGIKIELVTQELEGELGFSSVCVVGKLNKKEAIVWDSGGASFQITCIDSETNMLKSYMGAFGASG